MPLRSNLMKSFFRWSLSIAFFLSIGLATAHGQEPVKVKLDAVQEAGERFEHVHKLLQDLVDRKEIAGAVVLIQHKGKPVCSETFGMADVEAKKPMAPDTIFRIASMTKPLTSAAVMMLVDDGKLKL